MNDPERVDCRIEEIEVQGLLSSLVEKSLVVFDDNSRRYLLLESVRAYGRDLLVEIGEADEIRGRHIAYFVTIADAADLRMMGVDQETWLKQIEAEHDNFRKALELSVEDNTDSELGLRLAAGIWRFWMTHGFAVEGRKWLASALNRGAQVRNALTGNALNAAAGLAVVQGDLDTARALFLQSLSIRRELGDNKGIAASLNNLGITSFEQGDYVTARELYSEALAICRDLDDQWGIGKALGNLGTACAELEDFESALSCYEESLAICRSLGDTRGMAIALHNIGEDAHTMGNNASAWSRHSESLLLRRSLGDLDGIAFSLEGLAPVAGILFSPLTAARIWGAAEALREKIDTSIPQNTYPRYVRQIETARGILGDETAFDTAWKEGRVMSMEDAIEYTLIAEKQSNDSGG